MKVLWFTNTPGSGEEFINQNSLGGGWIKSLDKAIGKITDLHVAFAYPKPLEPFVHRGISYHPIIPNNWKRTWLKERIFLKIKDVDELSVYLEIIKKVKPNIIHIHGTENPFGSIIGKTEIPVVVSIQGNITVCYQKFLSGIEKKFLFKKEWNFNRIYDFPFYRSFKKSYRLFEKMKQREIKNLKNCKNIIGRTDWDRRITRILAPESRYFHVDEVLRDIFYQAQWAQPENKKLIIHTTNGNSPYKGFETLCQSLHLLNELGLNVEWRVAGIKENDLIVKITKSKLGKEFPKKGLVLMGGLEEKTLAEKLLESHIYVMPSHIENSPNNLCEAMILGMPCIATFAGGTGSLLKDGEEGILIQDGDPWAMAGAILELVNDPDKATRMGKNARKRALERHDRERIVKTLIDTYKTIIDGK